MNRKVSIDAEPRIPLERFFSSNLLQLQVQFLRRMPEIACQFLELDLQAALPLKLSFADVEKVRELAKRVGGLPGLESVAAVEHGIKIGRGGVWLILTSEQYARLKTS